MFEKMKEIISENLGIDLEKITESASFKEDLGIDSLDLFELVMALEEEFDISIPTEELEKMNTVGDVAKYIEEHQK
ncbi:MAG: acyl carrier protein [Eubacteriales bacterium]|nr:acyl carrier protein [Eubacteriales bacterium]